MTGIGTSYVGVDLAWGLRHRTGMAVLDESGRLIDIAEAVGDGDLLAWLAVHTHGPCLVAFDAPLVVTNETGRRACEAQLGRHFARYHAGAHPTSRAKAEFADGGRAYRLALELGLDVSDAAARRRAIEVYPHPAIVMLFGLDRVLPYKHKPGRDLPDLKAALLRLTGLLEGLETRHPPLHLAASAQWTALVDAVHGARRKSELRAVEDRVDAVLCAYIARYADARPAAVRTFGDVARGTILIPVDEVMAAEIDTATGSSDEADLT